VRGKFLSSQEEDVNNNQELTAAERLEALAELLARGIDRLAMRKQQRGKPGRCRRSASSPEAKEASAR
jgi:hypothetical protein